WRGLVRVALAPVGLQHRERGRELPTEHPQQTLTARAEVALALALEVEHSGQLAVDEQRNGRSALNALETRQLDLDRGRLAAASTDALLHGRVQRTAARKVRDADDPTPLRGNPDQADADWHLGSYTRRDVPVARDCEQPVAALVGGEQN